MNTLTFTQFQATGHDVAELGEVTGWGFEGPGRVYAGELAIERTEAGEFCLTIANCSWVEPLAQLELRLYNWAIAEGYFTTDAQVSS